MWQSFSFMSGHGKSHVDIVLKSKNLSCVSGKKHSNISKQLFKTSPRHFFTLRHHGEIKYGGTRQIEDDRSATFSEYIFLFPACLMISHWLTKNAELNSVF